MKVVSVPSNFEEFKKDLDEYSKKYKISPVLKNFLRKEYLIGVGDRNKKWIIYICGNVMCGRL